MLVARQVPTVPIAIYAYIYVCVYICIYIAMTVDMCVCSCKVVIFVSAYHRLGSAFRGGRGGRNRNVAVASSSSH